MPAADPLKRGLTAYDRLLHQGLPEALLRCGCEESAVELVKLLKTKPLDRAQLIDALDAASDAVLRIAVLQGPDAAAQSEQVLIVLSHVSQHEALESISPALSVRHLQRAVHLAEQIAVPS